MRHEKNQDLIRSLWACATMCDHCNTVCLEEEDVKVLAACIRLNTDCADICRLTATLLARGSEHVHHVMMECVEICEACAEECEKFSQLQHCSDSAEMCRQCAELCRNHYAVSA